MRMIDACSNTDVDTVMIGLPILVFLKMMIIIPTTILTALLFALVTPPWISKPKTPLKKRCLFVQFHHLTRANKGCKISACRLMSHADFPKVKYFHKFFLYFPLLPFFTIFPKTALSIATKCLFSEPPKIFHIWHFFLVVWSAGCRHGFPIIFSIWL